MPRSSGIDAIRLLLVGADETAGEWPDALESAGLSACLVVASSVSEAGAALRDPFDLVIAREGVAGRRAGDVEALLGEARCPVPLVAVAPTRAPSLLGAELRRTLAAAEAEARNALAERIAHDLSNLLAPIPLALQLLRQPTSGGARQADAIGGIGALDAVDVSSRRAIAAARDLSALLTAPEGQPVRVGAKHLLILASRAWSGFRVVTDYPPDLGCVRTRVVGLGRVLWCCARREIDRVTEGAGDAADPGPEAGDLVFQGRNLDGEVDLRVGWIGPGEGDRPLAGREVSGIAEGALGDAVAAQDGALEILDRGRGPGGFRLRLPVHPR